MVATKISVLAPCSQWTSLKCLDVQMRILNTTVTIGGGVLFFKPVNLLAQRMQNFGLFWPITIFLGKFALFSILFTGLKSALVYQN